MSEHRNCLQQLGHRESTLPEQWGADQPSARSDGCHTSELAATPRRRLPHEQPDGRTPGRPTAERLGQPAARAKDLALVATLENSDALKTALPQRRFARQLSQLQHAADNEQGLMYKNELRPR